MKVLAAAALFMLSSSALAGAAIKAFEPGKPPPKEVLANVPVKSVIAEFLDPDNTHLGKDLGYVLWRELLDAVSDQHGAGVIFAHAPDDTRLIETSYHEAALKIAEVQKVRMAIWGALTESEGVVSIDSYLSLVGDVTQEELALRMTSGIYHQTKATGYEARISRTRFNFPRIRIGRDALFDRLLVVAAETSLQKAARVGNALRAVHINENLHTDGIEGEWFRILLPDGKHAYIDSLQVLLPPRTVDAGGLSLGAKVCAAGNHSGAALPTGSIGTVLAAERFAKAGLCYRIKTAQGEGWVPASLARRFYSLPVVQFAAGLYRYQLGHYDLAIKSFEDYVRLDSSSEDPPSLSTAYQLLAASNLMGDYPRARPALSALASAVEVTPYDASAFSMRALAYLSDEGSVAATIPDLSKALELNPEQPDARNIVSMLIGIKPDKFNPLAYEGGRFTMGDAELKYLQGLATKYAIAAR